MSPSVLWAEVHLSPFLERCLELMPSSLEFSVLLVVLQYCLFQIFPEPFYIFSQFSIFVLRFPLSTMLNDLTTNWSENGTHERICLPLKGKNILSAHLGAFLTRLCLELGFLHHHLIHIPLVLLKFGFHLTHLIFQGAVPFFQISLKENKKVASV